MSIEPVAVADDSTHPAPSSLLTPLPRFTAVDLLRGAVMVLMVLDHTRDFFGDVSLDPTDLTKSSPALFLTRWVTHVCAPVFAFLAGTGAYLAGVRGRSRAGHATYLATRGLWLILLELTVVNFALRFNPAPTTILLTVLWSIGGSFVLLSGLVYLPGRVLGAFGVLLIATHNLLDLNALSAGALNALQPLSTFLLRPGLVSLPGDVSLIVGYPVLPWFGVVAAGYGFGEIIRLEPKRRTSVMLATGVGLTLAFVALRTSGVYGEPRAWTSQPTPLLTALSFVNCTKYPPSLLFLLMTLGPALVALAVCDQVGARGPVGRALITLGRVPLFFYIGQWYVIHSLAVVMALARGFSVEWLFAATFPPSQPSSWPLDLPGVYVTWAVVLALLYGPCRWFAGVKKRHHEGWLSYL
jgi:uncharacterized membrane protein